MHVGSVWDLDVVKQGDEGVKTLSLEDTGTNQAMKQYRRVYYHLLANADRSKAAVPIEGDRVKIDFGRDPDEAGFKDSDEKKHWGGVVMSAAPERLRAANADFCVVAKIPGSRINIPSPNRPQCVHIKLEIDKIAAKRERLALYEFFNTAGSKLQRSLHQAMEDLYLGEPDDANLFSLLAGPESAEAEDQVHRNEESERLLTFLEGHPLNESQAAAIHEMGHLLHRIGLVCGPPGTGKTLTLIHAAMMLFEAGHKMLITGTTNNCVDDNTVKLVELIKLWLTVVEGSKAPKVQRVEKGSEQVFSENAIRGNDG